MAEVVILGREGRGALCQPFHFPPSIRLWESLRETQTLAWGEWQPHKMVLYVSKRDELLFWTYPEKPIPPLFNISVSFVPCQVTLQERRPGACLLPDWLYETSEGRFSCDLSFLDANSPLVGLVWNFSKAWAWFNFRRWFYSPLLSFSFKETVEGRNIRVSWQFSVPCMKIPLSLKWVVVFSIWQIDWRDFPRYLASN